MKKSFYTFFAVVALGAGVYFFAQGLGYKTVTANACEGSTCEGPVDPT